MARTNKNSMSYMNKKLMTDDEYKKAVAALNMRLRRVSSSKFSDFSKTLSEVDKFKTILTAKGYKGKFNTNMVTKSGNISSSLKGFSEKEKRFAKTWLKNMLEREDLVVPTIRKKVTKRADELGTTVDNYLKDKEFWKMFREIKEETEYGSGETFNAVEIAESQANTYEERKRIAQRALDEYHKWQDDDDLSEEDLPDLGTISGEEMINILSKAMTKQRVTKRSIRKK